MKRIFFAFAALTCVAVCLSSCSKEDFEEQLYEGREAVAGTVGAAQPVSHDLRTHVVAVAGHMKICGPDINGSSSSKGHTSGDEE